MDKILLIKASSRLGMKYIPPKGIFTGQFFGVNDSWNGSEPQLVFHTKKQALDLLSGLNILEFTEEEKDGEAASGHKKHWHVFHFIVQKI